MPRWPSILLALVQLTLNSPGTASALELTPEERAFVAAHPVITVGGETDWPPMDYVEDGVYKGAAKDYLDEIAAISGIEFNVVTGYTWSELMGLLRDQEIDMVPMMYWTAHRGREFNLTNPYITVRHYVFTNGNRPDINDFGDLYGKTMAIPAGYAHIEYLNRHHPDIRITEVPSILDAMDAVLIGKADAIIENTASMAYYTSHHSILGLAPAFPVRFEVDNVHMAVRKDWPLLRDILQKALDQISAESTTLIMAKWTGSEAAAKTFLTSKAEFSSTENAYLRNRGQLTACLNTNRMPLESFRGMNHEGMTADYLAVLADTLKVPVAVSVSQTWAEVRQQLAAGKCDLVTLAVATESARDGLILSSPYIDERLALATTMRQGFYESLADLTNTNIGFVTGYIDVDHLRAKFPGIEFIGFPALHDGLEAVSDGEIFGFLDYVPTLSNAIRSDYERELKISGDFADESRGFSFAVRGSEPLLASIIHKTVAALPDALRQNIHRKWVAVYVDKEADYSLLVRTSVAATLVLLFLLYRYLQVRKHRKEAQIANMRLEDINSRLEQEADSALHMAHHDPLTGLPNRAKLIADLDHLTKMCRRTGSKLAVMFLDLDRFKPVNDTLGHEVGDKLLRAVAERMQGLLRETDTLCRIGGDEFVIILEAISADNSPSVVAGKVVAAIAEPFPIDEHSVSIGTSIGIAMFPDDADDLQDLLKNADSAMYSAKENGRNGYCYYHDELEKQALRRTGIQIALRRSLEEQDFTLVLQPIVDLERREVTRAEALVRWNHPMLGNVTPDEFIPIAEEFGLIADIGESALKKACDALRRLTRQGIELDAIAVNLSRAEITQGIIATQFRRIARENGIRPTQIHIEIAENALPQLHESAEIDLQSLHQTGHAIIADDFGNGALNLRQLTQQPLHGIKIDRDLIQNIPHDQHDMDACKAIIGLAHSLGYEVGATGVETENQFDFLVNNGCDFAQGFYFSEPVATELFCERASQINEQIRLNAGWTSRLRAIRI